jgi:ankyrin repeat protein
MVRAEFTRMLLERGAMIDACEGGRTPLHWAAINGEIGAVRLLLEARRGCQCARQRWQHPFKLPNWGPIGGGITRLQNCCLRMVPSLWKSSTVSTMISLQY